jgi:hypothetical protein
LFRWDDRSTGTMKDKMEEGRRFECGLRNADCGMKNGPGNAECGIELKSERRQRARKGRIVTPLA